MIVSPSPEPGISLALVEFALTVVAFAIAFVIPRLGSAWFSRIERTFSHLARKRGLAVIAVGVSTLMLRLAMLPLRPIPLPFLPDDFSFLFGANTFALGRLTNPTPGDVDTFRDHSHHHGPHLHVHVLSRARAVSGCR